MIFVDAATEEAFELVRTHAFLAGLTTNPTILQRDRPECGLLDAATHLNRLPGWHFVQGAITHTDWISRLDGLAQQGTIDRRKFAIKVPWDPLEISDITCELHERSWSICATAVYTTSQYVAAIELDVDCVAVYYDRIRQADRDPLEFLDALVRIRDLNDGPAILVASVKSPDDVDQALRMGVDHVTLSPDVFDRYFRASFPHEDDRQFESDFRL